MKDYSLYVKAYIPDRDFPVQVFRHDYDSGSHPFSSHWHEQIEFLYFIEGSAVIECDSCPICVSPGDLVIVNSNELHSARYCKKNLSYYCIIIDPSLYRSSFPDACEIKYISPIASNLILFENKISKDGAVSQCINDIIEEYECKKVGYELAVKASVFRLLVILLRNHVKRVLTQKEYNSRLSNLKRFENVMKYIEDNYTEKITIKELSRIAGLSVFHFCHLFKNLTGKSAGEFINSFRIDKAEELLKSTGLNITEVALASGFNDANYFSKQFKKYKMVPPSMIKKNIR